MTQQHTAILRLTLGLTTTVAVSYGMGWTLNFITPIFAAIFLIFPAWIGWKNAANLLLLLAIALLFGLIISEYFLKIPIICVPLLGLLLFFIYFYDTPKTPPVAATFMTFGITLVPIMGLSGTLLPHIIALALFLNMAAGLFIAWFFHGLIPGHFRALSGSKKPEKPGLPPEPPESERTRKALISATVALIAVVIFFAFNLSSHAFAMIQICLMAGAPSAAASYRAMKDNALACLIGGIAIIIVYNLLTVVPSFLFLIAITLYAALFFSRKIFSDGSMVKTWTSGLTTFLVLLGTSTAFDASSANANFYLRIVQILFAGLFSASGLLIVDRLLWQRKKQRTTALIKPEQV